MLFGDTGFLLAIQYLQRGTGSNPSLLPHVQQRAPHDPLPEENIPEAVEWKVGLAQQTGLFVEGKEVAGFIPYGAVDQQDGVRCHVTQPDDDCFGRYIIPEVECDTCSEGLGNRHEMLAVQAFRLIMGAADDYDLGCFGMEFQGLPDYSFEIRLVTDGCMFAQR